MNAERYNDQVREFPSEHNVDIKELDALREKRMSAAQKRYNEHIADSNVTNSYLALAIFGLTIAVGVLGFMCFRTQRLLSSFQPFVIRVDRAGQAEAINYGDMSYHPQEPEMRHFLTRWVELRYSRNHFSFSNDYALSFLFLESHLAENEMALSRKNKVEESFLKDPSTPNVFVDVQNVVIDQIQRPPYKATIEFLSKQVPVGSTEPTQVQRITVTADFQFNPINPKDSLMVKTNPLGLTILGFHDQQAFEVAR